MEVARVYRACDTGLPSNPTLTSPRDDPPLHAGGDIEAGLGKITVLVGDLVVDNRADRARLRAP